MIARPANSLHHNELADVTVEWMDGRIERFNPVRFRSFSMGTTQTGWEIIRDGDCISIPGDNVRAVTWRRIDQDEPLKQDIVDELTDTAIRVDNDEVRSLLIRSRKEIAHLRTLHDLSLGKIK